MANLDFSFHIYGSDSSTRAVVVNGSRLREGERFGRFKLLQVLEDGGVVLEMNTGSRATRVRLPNVMEPLPEA
ncbi:MAG: general secretion pathway protein GspB [Pseudomonadota bacterium]